MPEYEYEDESVTGKGNVGGSAWEGGEGGASYSPTTGRPRPGDVWVD